MPRGLKPPKTAEERRARSAQAQKAIATRNAKRDGAASVVAPRPIDPATSLPGVCAYDVAYTSGKISLREALVREQVIGEELQNERRRIEIETARGKLLPAEAVAARDEAWNKIVLAALDAVDRLLDTVEGITPAQRAAFLERANAWRKETRSALAGGGNAG